MTAIFTRKALIAWGQTPPADLALVIHEPLGQRRVVTWEDIKAQRRQRQQAILARKRAGRPRQAYRLWVAFYDTTIFGGWQAFLDTYTGERVWIDRDRTWLRPLLLALYPCVLPLGKTWQPQWPAWERWKPAFAQQYSRRQQARKPLGVTYVWWDGAQHLSHLAERPCKNKGGNA